jgi:hypothetical protein
VLPSDIAAKAICDFPIADETPDIVHLVHPYSVSWRTFVEYFGGQFRVPVVPRDRWLEAMSKTKIVDNPALKLLSYFQARPIAPKDGREVSYYG